MNKILLQINLLSYHSFMFQLNPKIIQIHFLLLSQDYQSFLISSYLFLNPFFIYLYFTSIVIVLFYSSNSIFISKSDGTYSPFYVAKNLYFSNASEAFDNNSLKNTSLSVYIDLATISSNFFVSALNSCFSYFSEQNLYPKLLFILNNLDCLNK